jgi:hypothetical protein
MFKGNGALPYRQCAHQTEEVHGKEEQMRHPSEAELALHAGGDLGWFRQKITARHIGKCDACQVAVVEFSELRPEVRNLPELPWSSMASEMTANIRLGLEAGECVTIRRTARDWGLGTREIAWPRLALASLILFAMAGAAYIVQHPLPTGIPVALPSAQANIMLMEASENGLQVRDAGQTLRLLNTSGSAVSRSVGSRGELGARYLDSNGYVTISQVYGQ